MITYGKRVAFLTLSLIIFGAVSPLTNLRAAETNYVPGDIEIKQLVMDEDEELISFVHSDEEITYELRISNGSVSSLEGMEVTDTLEGYLEYQPGTTTINGENQEDEYVWDGNVLSYDLGNVQDSDEVVIQFSAVVKGSNKFDSVFNQASIYDKSQDLDSTSSLSELLYLD